MILLILSSLLAGFLVSGCPTVSDHNQCDLNMGLAVVMILDKMKYQSGKPAEIEFNNIFLAGQLVAYEDCLAKEDRADKETGILGGLF